jgi:hypothetical protein
LPSIHHTTFWQIGIFWTSNTPSFSPACTQNPSPTHSRVPILGTKMPALHQIREQLDCIFTIVLILCLLRILLKGVGSLSSRSSLPNELVSIGSPFSVVTIPDDENSTQAIQGFLEPQGHTHTKARHYWTLPSKDVEQREGNVDAMTTVQVHLGPQTVTATKLPTSSISEAVLRVQNTMQVSQQYEAEPLPSTFVTIHRMRTTTITITLEPVTHESQTTAAAGAPDLSSEPIRFDLRV